MDTKEQKLIDAVIGQIILDLKHKELECLEILLNNVSIEDLISFLPEHKGIVFRDGYKS